MKNQNADKATNLEGRVAMQIGPDARYFTARHALSGNAPEIRINSLISIQTCRETENPFPVQKPIGLCNKPYTLLRTAGFAPSRIFHFFCNQTKSNIKIKRGNTHQTSKHEFITTFTYSKTRSVQDSDHLSATAFNLQKQNGFTSFTRLSFFRPRTGALLYPRPRSKTTPDRNLTSGKQS